MQKPHPPIVVGGHSPSAFRRAVARGNGWYGFLRDLETARKDLAGLAEAARAVPRPAGLGPLEISITPPPRTDLDAAQRYRDLGVARLTLLAPRGEEEILRFVAETEPLVRKLA